MSRIYLVVWNDWLGEASRAILACPTLKAANTKQDIYNKEAVREFRLEYPEGSKEVSPDYYTIEEVEYCG